MSEVWNGGWRRQGENRTVRVCRAVDASGLYPEHEVIRAAGDGDQFLVLLKHRETGALLQIEWTDADPV